MPEQDPRRRRWSRRVAQRLGVAGAALLLLLPLLFLSLAPPVRRPHEPPPPEWQQVDLERVIIRLRELPFRGGEYAPRITPDDLEYRDCRGPRRVLRADDLEAERRRLLDRSCPEL